MLVPVFKCLRLLMRHSPRMIDRTKQRSLSSRWSSALFFFLFARLVILQGSCDLPGVHLHGLSVISFCRLFEDINFFTTSNCHLSLVNTCRSLFVLLFLSFSLVPRSSVVQSIDLCIFYTEPDLFFCLFSSSFFHLKRKKRNETSASHLLGVLFLQWM